MQSLHQKSKGYFSTDLFYTGLKSDLGATELEVSNETSMRGLFKLIEGFESPNKGFKRVGSRLIS